MVGNGSRAFKFKVIFILKGGNELISVLAEHINKLIVPYLFQQEHTSQKLETREITTRENRTLGVGI